MVGDRKIMSNIVSIKPESKKRKKSVRKRIIIGIVMLLILVAAGVVGWRVYEGQRKPAEQSTESEVNPQPIVIASPEDIQNRIDAEADDKAKADLYSELSTTHQLNGDNQQALEAAIRAHELDSSLSRIVVVAAMYEAVGDKTKALEYYKKALEKTSPPSSPGVRSDYADYQAKIKELEG